MDCMGREARVDNEVAAWTDMLGIVGRTTNADDTQLTLPVTGIDL